MIGYMRHLEMVEMNDNVESQKQESLMLNRMIHYHIKTQSALNSHFRMVSDGGSIVRVKGHTALQCSLVPLNLHAHC